jgi:pyruvate dehydrogenase E1 component alpha subunit
LDVSAETLIKLYVTMQRIRLFEERVADLVSKGEITTPCHLYTGQEAVATGICASLRNDDYVFSTHRSHGHYIAKGGDLRKLMAEIYCKSTGCSKGRGGSMHITSAEKGLPGSSAIVAGTIPIAVGAALRLSAVGGDGVSVAFFGDGAVCEGAFYEALNFASLKKLPVIFVCENNLFSTHMPVEDSLANPIIYKIAEAFKLPSCRIDGNDVLKVYKTGQAAIERARKRKGPSFIECMTYRWRGHVGPNYDVDKGIRTQKELDRWMAKDPIKALEKMLIAKRFLTNGEASKIVTGIEREIDGAVAFAKKSPYPPSDEMEIIRYLFR